MVSNRSLADWMVGFSVCSGPRPGGHFFQREAWEARALAVDATERTIRALGGDTRGQ